MPSLGFSKSVFDGDNQGTESDLDELVCGEAMSWIFRLFKTFYYCVWIKYKRHNGVLKVGLYGALFQY